MPLLVVYNPVSGDSSGGAFFKEHVLPLLKDKNVTPDRVEETTAPGHAGTLVADFLATVSESTEAVSVILGSGDGTLHELINALNNAPSSKHSQKSSMRKHRNMPELICMIMMLELRENLQRQPA